ncbi:hypothetical protein L1887_50183 [Cichorium endivia]|nr:hypothetical protein L1887_50183 [Cichorium endivia]
MQADYVRRSFVAITNVWHKGLVHPEVTMDGCEAEAGLGTTTDGRRPKLHSAGFVHGPWPTIPWDSKYLSALGLRRLLFCVVFESLRTPSRDRGGCETRTLTRATTWLSQGSPGLRLPWLTRPARSFRWRKRAHPSLASAAALRQTPIIREHVRDGRLSSAQLGKA